MENLAKCIKTYINAVKRLVRAEKNEIRSKDLNMYTYVTVY